VFKKGLLLIATAILVIGSAFAAINNIEVSPACHIDTESCSCNN